MAPCFLSKTETVNGSGRGRALHKTRRRHPMAQALLKGKYEYRRRLPHYQKPDGVVFVTFCAGTQRPLKRAA